jgi:hypothetical protein
MHDEARKIAALKATAKADALCEKRRKLEAKVTKLQAPRRLKA